MEELAELIYYRGDMNRVNSFKPDKRAILEETVKYFHRLQSEGGKLQFDAKFCFTLCKQYLHFHRLKCEFFLS